MRALRTAAEANTFGAHDFKRPRSNAINPTKATFQQYCAGICATCKSVDHINIANLLVRSYAWARSGSLRRDEALRVLAEHRREVAGVKPSREEIWALVKDKYEEVSRLRSGYLGPKELLRIVKEVPAVRREFKVSLLAISARLVEKDEAEMAMLEQEVTEEQMTSLR
mmetsp:Transcript_19519/g.59048  ORF Transcript_19519/g.59048 Transcript_19519/m.59048 type:complete len:168 (-) Transcript_19519:42-545(-)